MNDVIGNIALPISAVVILGMIIIALQVVIIRVNERLSKIEKLLSGKNETINEGNISNDQEDNKNILANIIRRIKQ